MTRYVCLFMASRANPHCDLHKHLPFISHVNGRFLRVSRILESATSAHTVAVHSFPLLIPLSWPWTFNVKVGRTMWSSVSLLSWPPSCWHLNLDISSTTVNCCSSRKNYTSNKPWLVRSAVVRPAVVWSDVWYSVVLVWPTDHLFLEKKTCWNGRGGGVTGHGMVPLAGFRIWYILTAAYEMHTMKTRGIVEADIAVNIFLHQSE